MVQYQRPNLVHKKLEHLLQKQPIKHLTEPIEHHYFQKNIAKYQPYTADTNKENSPLLPGQWADVKITNATNNN